MMQAPRRRDVEIEQAGERQVDRTGQVPGLELVRLAHVEDEQVVALVHPRLQLDGRNLPLVGRRRTRDRRGFRGERLQRFDAAPGRRSLVARIEGTDPGAPSLCLMAPNVAMATPNWWITTRAWRG